MTDVVRKDVLARLQNGDFSCAKELTLAMFSGKWKLVILCHLNSHGAYRFNELRRLLPTITHKVLTNQLRELAQDQLITRHESVQGRRHVAYAITELGRSLMPIIEAMRVWGEQRITALPVAPNWPINEAIRPAHQLNKEETRCIKQH
ncbi:winged helix-turn-helix transcriptional regulator [Lacticaseibacillus baoqingensis]|uniref:Winged helix-turn-helix transcriptional regulator n=1 Tax=Lacticaseibacillus baoqingensis TaxID=2486013 RepID=A0ABW4E9T2_9LACO|nr:helix-turn-helix domain-containing protein [Lacticaseibacillus baoqingensis]